ncbi:MAG: YwaF family protein [Firmicutes bacterium]|nr:YwaF family protein [Bacillota bacterium]
MLVKTNSLIMVPGNSTFFLTFAFFILLLIVSGLLLRGKRERTKQIVLLIACVITFIGYWMYKYALSMDAEYAVLHASMGGFNWWDELPLHLCNINMMLIPIAVLTKNRPLLSFCFLVGPLGALMAVAMPGVGFSGFPLFLPRILGYYGTHFMIIIEGLALAVFGLYRPRYRDLPGTVLAALALEFIVFLISLLLRTAGLSPHANYFFTIETEGNPLLEIFHSWIPYPFLYLLPCIPILLVYMLIVTTGFRLFGGREDAPAKRGSLPI